MQQDTALQIEVVEPQSPTAPPPYSSPIVETSAHHPVQSACEARRHTPIQSPVHLSPVIRPSVFRPAPTASTAQHQAPTRSPACPRPDVVSLPADNMLSTQPKSPGGSSQMRSLLILAWIPSFSIALPYNITVGPRYEGILFTILISASAGLSSYAKLSPAFKQQGQSKSTIFSFSSPTTQCTSVYGEAHNTLLSNDDDDDDNSGQSQPRKHVEEESMLADDPMQDKKHLCKQASRCFVVGLCDVLLAAAYFGTFIPFIVRGRIDALSFFILYGLFTYFFVHAFLAIQMLKSLPFMIKIWHGIRSNKETVVHRCPDCRRQWQPPVPERQGGSPPQSDSSSGMYHVSQASSRQQQQQRGKILLVDPPNYLRDSLDMDNQRRADEVRMASPEPVPTYRDDPFDQDHGA